MKKIKNIFATFLLVVFSSLCFVGCMGDDDKNKGNEQNQQQVVYTSAKEVANAVYAEANNIYSYSLADENGIVIVKFQKFNDKYAMASFDGEGVGKENIIGYNEVYMIAGVKYAEIYYPSQLTYTLEESDMNYDIVANQADYKNLCSGLFENVENETTSFESLGNNKYKIALSDSENNTYELIVENKRIVSITYRTQDEGSIVVETYCLKEFNTSEINFDKTFYSRTTAGVFQNISNICNNNVNSYTINILSNSDIQGSYNIVYDNNMICVSAQNQDDLIINYYEFYYDEGSYYFKNYNIDEKTFSIESFKTIDEWYEKQYGCGIIKGIFENLIVESNNPSNSFEFTTTENGIKVEVIIDDLPMIFTIENNRLTGFKTLEDNVTYIYSSYNETTINFDKTGYVEV